ncbi:hypothetical protein [Desulfobotulus sp.]|uniref:hypothetical protein n=1 Tax=Desulfobotulus sp. TaxID=1940337 RepID=UPI002A35F9EE|nr:hypothetical protein [Desulfobotulus sp.]MDY0164771.1 hypothetical protein [Desulfobotulus sp.]
MSASHSLSATEKLLERIRSEAGVPSSPPVTQPGVSFFPGKGARTLGISFSPDAIFMVESLRTRKGWRLTRHARFPLTTAPNPSSPSFAEALRRALMAFIGKGRNVDIWLLMGAADVEIRLLSLAPAPEKELPQAVFWALKKEMGQDLPKDMVYDFSVVGRRMEEGRLRLETLVCQGRKSTIEPLHRLFSSLGYGLAGISIASFAYENLLREGRMSADGQAVCTLFVGFGWSRIDIFQGRHIRLSRDIKTGFNSLVEVVQEEMRRVMSDEGEPGEPSFDLAVSVVTDVLEGGTVRWRMKGREFTLSDTRMRELGQPVLLRLIRQVERTLEYYVLNVKGDPVSLLYLSGQMVRNPRLMRALSRQFTLPVKALDAFEQEDFSGSEPAPDTAYERDQMTPAAGMALASEKTPNLLFTWKERREARRNRRLTMAVSLVGLLVFGLLFGFSVFEKGRLESQVARNRAMEAQLGGFNASLEPEMVAALQKNLENRREDLRKRAERFGPVALVGEVLRRTPESILLERVYWERRAEAPKSGAAACVEIDGRILRKGEGPAPESLLATYGLDLSQASFFLGTRVRRQAMGEGGSVLTFGLSVDCHGDFKP